MVDVSQSQNSTLNRFSAALIMIGLIWLLFILQLIGIMPDLIPRLLPRHISGLPGILSMPFLHGSFAHLVSNTVPLVLFAALISLKGNRYFLQVTLFIVILSGAMLWLMGRGAFHIGASGLIFGYFGFLLMRTYYSPSIGTIIISTGVLVFYGGILYGVLPQGGGISWEGHLFGFLSGVAVAKLIGEKGVLSRR